MAGTGVLDGVVRFFDPNYLLAALWTWQTACVSWLADIALIAWNLRRGMD